jgi:hypothetical protein
VILVPPRDDVVHVGIRLADAAIEYDPPRFEPCALLTLGAFSVATNVMPYEA